MGIYYCEEDCPNELMPYKLSNTNITIVTIADEPEHTEEIDVGTKCSMDII